MDEALASLVFEFVGEFVWAAITGPRKSPTIVPDSDAADHVGKWITVEGVISNRVEMGNGDSALSFGGRYPTQTLTARIPTGARVANSWISTGIEGKRVKITGLVRMHEGKPEITIYTQHQIKME